MTIAYSYIRFSHPDQRRGNSLRRQLARSRKYADAKSLELDDSIRDFARSAFHNRHTVTGNLGGFLALVRQREIAPGSYLLIESFDRLSRDEFWPAFDLIRDIFKARINITTLPDEDEVHEYSYDAINKNPTLINEIINDLTRAHRESKFKSARCSDACEVQREEARAGIAKIPGRCPAWLIPIRGTIMVEVDGEMREKNATIGFKKNDKLVAVVKLIFEWAMSMGVKAIVSRLNREDRPKFGPSGWHSRTVAMVLHNRAVMGYKQPGKMVDGIQVADGPEIKDHYPCIIDPDTFHRVQGAIKARRTGAAAGRHGVKYPNLLRGITRCVKCGRPLHYAGVSDKSSPSLRYLICSKGKRDLCENHRHYLYDRLEAELLTVLPLIDFSRLVQRSNSPAAHGEALAAEIAEKSEQLTALARRKISPEIETVIDELTDQLASLRKELATVNESSRIAEAMSKQDRYAEFVQLVARMKEPDLDESERFLIRSKLATEFRRLIDVVEAKDNTLTIRFKSAHHHRIEILLVDQLVKHLDGWGRDMSHSDYPNNPMEHHVRFDRDALLDPNNEFIGTFGQFVAAA